MDILKTVIKLGGRKLKREEEKGDHFYRGDREKEGVVL